MLNKIKLPLAIVVIAAVWLVVGFALLASYQYWDWDVLLAFATWILAAATSILAGLAFWAGRVAWKDLQTNREQLETLRDSSDIQLFSALLQEISGDEASYDRGMIRDIDCEAEVEKIKELVNKGRNLSKELRLFNLKKGKGEPPEIEDDALVGIALERTIARYDRVGFFLMGEGNELRMRPPTWLWTHVRYIWLRLCRWIEYRQKCEQDKIYYHPDYAKYLQKLANLRNAGARQASSHD